MRSHLPVIAQVLTFDSVRVGSGRSRRVGTVRRMVTVTRTVLVDDLDGSQDDVHTVRFSLDGTDFEIDLNAGNEARLRDKLARFVENATPVRAPRGRARTGGRVSRPPASDPDQTRAIRAWAAANGYAVSTRGRIPRAVQDAFAAAH